MRRVGLHNLGCKVNGYEADVIAGLLKERGYTIVPFDTPAAVYIINTCTVTNIADRKTRQMLRRARAMNPDALVVAMGCYVDTHACADRRSGEGGYSRPALGHSRHQRG